jgi:hypothetical protein
MREGNRNAWLFPRKERSLFASTRPGGYPQQRHSLTHRMHSHGTPRRASAQEAKWKQREEGLVGELNTLGKQYQAELESRLAKEIALHERMFENQLHQKEEEMRLAAHRDQNQLLEKEARVLQERETLWQKQQEARLVHERESMKAEQDQLLAVEVSLRTSLG